ncbi:hypothetical protein SAMN05444007_108241 [Cribrihabitans marinus]|uniref:Uncharacterized protein n=1 Tax=Cribrihabitans marinus TaxID=1227549 RepID=A0A1H7CP18_9RHOB|nr:hypothetical protein [Cribrihabitans marinus]GGH36252.1 hypothetical protein GCM10010973_30110 [Cribrihabitans marinus]SEJ91428.1 hypothetical protein SAMN05444007_108241 [Cribrihabitans marinus]
MEKQEAVEMMERASSEIKNLRAQVAELRPRAEAFDAVQNVLGLTCSKSLGYTEDWAWMLDKRAAELKAELAAEKASAVEGE